MQDDRLKFLVQNFGGVYGGSGISTTLERTVKPDQTQTPQTAQPGVFDKIAKVVGQTARVGAQAIGVGAKFVANSAVDIGQAAVGVANTLSDIQTQPLMLKTANQLNDQLDQNQ